METSSSNTILPSVQRDILYAHGGPVPFKSVKLYSWMGKQPKDFTVGRSFQHSCSYACKALSIYRPGGVPQVVRMLFAVGELK